jgi:hypothetical protein
LPDVYRWIHEFPRASIDDFGPKSCDEFVVGMRARLPQIRSWGFVDDAGELAGIHAYIQASPWLGVRDGMCFAKGHFSHVQKIALNREILEQLFAEGTGCIESVFLAHNEKIWDFLSELGFSYQGTLAERTLQDGVPVDMMCMGLLAVDYRKAG